MSVTSKTLDSTVTEQEDKTAHRFVNWGVYLNIILGISIVYAATRVYMHEFAYTVGLDYFEPEFAVYWMPILYSELIIEAVALVGMCGYLWVTRDKDVASLTPRAAEGTSLTLLPSDLERDPHQTDPRTLSGADRVL